MPPQFLYKESVTMIHIVPKPTDTFIDNSTAMVIRELERAGSSPQLLNLDVIDPFSEGPRGCVIWICGLRQDTHQFEVLNALAAENRLINTPDAILACASKVKTSAILFKSGIRSPETLFSASRDRAEAFIDRWGAVVSKPVYGYDGKDIRLVRSSRELGPPPYYLQEYIRNDRDFRVFVIDGEAVGAISRTSDSLAHNIHQGGVGCPCHIDDSMQEISQAAARAVGVDYGGVDLLIQDEAYTVLEVNGTPNWHCMAAPIPILLAEYLIEKEREFNC
jgi:tetrahydromethanopterin:alpha-L-glutamate ligase